MNGPNLGQRKTLTPITHNCQDPEKLMRQREAEPPIESCTSSKYPFFFRPGKCKSLYNSMGAEAVATLGPFLYSGLSLLGPSTLDSPIPRHVALRSTEQQLPPSRLAT